MPAVFVHGVPDTHRVWQRVLSELDRQDVLTLSLPGFGCPVPAGFDATKEAYVDWLVGTLREIGQPVDLVGHDWGALLVMRAACLAPECIRTWAAGAAPIDPQYEWHETARGWQTPELGEQMMAMITPELMAPGLQAAGVPEAEAREAASHVDAVMKDCILKLYRSAITVNQDWEPELRGIAGPGLILWGEHDAFAAPVHGERTAAGANARFQVFPKCNHWWQLERPEEVAAALSAHWESA